MAVKRASQDFLKVLNKDSATKVRNIFFKSDKVKPGKYIEAQQKYAAHIYDPVPVVVAKAEGTLLWDTEGKQYLDFLAGYATLNTGHSHPKILSVLKEQAGILHHTSRSIYNTELPIFFEYAAQYFNYDKIIPMNTGVEAADTAIKLARKWGYLKKGIPENEALVVFVTGNFWGRSLSAISTSTKELTYQHYGPYMPGFGLIPFDSVPALEEVLTNPNVCAFMVEPILGEGGVVVPSDRYLSEVRRLCTKNNVLWIADEIQTGLGRTGKLLAVDHECVRPDLLLIGKGLAGGFVPMSMVLGNDEVMSLMTPGSHGSTFGGNPLAAKLAIKTLEVILEECLIENAKIMGEKLRYELTCHLPKHIVPCIRGRGLLNAIELNPEFGNANKLVQALKNLGLITKNCCDKVVRLTPPLTITEEEMSSAIKIISDAVHSLKK